MALIKSYSNYLVQQAKQAAILDYMRRTFVHLKPHINNSTNERSACDFCFSNYVLEPVYNQFNSTGENLLVYCEEGEGGGYEHCSELF